jgi:hypothetical protein
MTASKTTTELFTRATGKGNAGLCDGHTQGLRDTEAERREFLAATVPPSARRLMLRTFAGKASPRQAIKAKCLDCCGYDRAEVANCTVVLCPLHAYRPYVETRRSRPKSERGNEISDTAGLHGSSGTRPSRKTSKTA